MFLKPSHKTTLRVPGKTNLNHSQKVFINRKKRMSAFLTAVVYVLIILITIALMLILFTLLIKVNIKWAQFHQISLTHSIEIFTKSSTWFYFRFCFSAWWIRKRRNLLKQNQITGCSLLKAAGEVLLITYLNHNSFRTCELLLVIRRSSNPDWNQIT